MTSHNYIFFTAHKALHDIPKVTRDKYKKEFLKTLTSEKKVIAHSYATIGLKVNTQILIWFQADAIDTIQNLLNNLMHTHLGKYLTITETLFGMTRQTQYSPTAIGHLDTNRKGGRYLIIYPFTKTKEWYMLDFDTRRKLMGGHVSIGKKYKMITQQLLYSYGIDDSEFIVSYEMDDLSAFQSLVMELRTDKVRVYTQKDTPIFTCVYKSPEAVLDFL
ncbi:MAG TPA: chlorite dismutase family protein [Methylomirabilota bacterium]|nr:chlorite dismutase family protein [Methylomirabilota bacterium]